MTKFKQVKLVRFIDEESPLRAVGFSNNGFGKCVLVETSDGGDPVPKPAMRLSNKDLWEKWTS
ncbi:hypothetical protein CL632_03885 [bacterium]|jgi:hypothetical protein|nr:hypothetical protein [bacterium]MDP6756342.1 hypothetical protein [Patescibacteria group bacterium]